MVNLIGAIDEGTSSTRFLVFDADSEKLVCSHQEAITSLYPNEGWCEQDPCEILTKTLTCIEEAVKKLTESGHAATDIKAIGITNQRETTVVWDKETGKPLCHAVVWLDGRTTSTVEALIAKTPTKSKTYLQERCGLPIATYFSAVKLRWLFDNESAVKAAADQGKCLFGTVDSWLLWNMTGGTSNGCHVTDVTNASRTMLMNLATQQWDDVLCSFFEIPKEILPCIKSSSEVYGKMCCGVLKDVPISGILGDQQAALVGQKCFNSGDAKNTYGTGNFLLYNTGTKAVQSKHGLLTTAAYKFGPDEPLVYALEGSIAITGEAVKWLRDSLGLISSASESESLAMKVKDNGGVYFVPAFSGLYAPYWMADARGLIIGLTQFSNKNHIARATLEAVCFQTREILDAMNADSGIPLKVLLVDGGMTANTFLMQLQADFLGIEVVRPAMPETTALGAAIAAGLAKGIDAWKIDFGNEKDKNTSKPSGSVTFKPQLDAEEREKLYAKWKIAVQRSMGWESC